MKLIIRDDDLSYFANPKILEYLYGDIWDKIPICFSVIPKIYSRQKESPVNINHEKDFYFIYENRELVDFLKEKIKEKKAAIYQHGLSHRNYNGKFELERDDFDLIFKELSEGKKILEQTFDVKIDTIVAPHDRWSKEAMRAAEKIGYKYVSRAFAPLPREIQFNNKYLSAYLRIMKFWITNGRKLRFPDYLDFGKHKEVYSYRIQEISMKNIKDIIKNAKSGILSITTHYRALNILQKEILKIITKKTIL